jgi:hypothetical protein
MFANGLSGVNVCGTWASSCRNIAEYVLIDKEYVIFVSTAQPLQGFH